MVFPELLIPSAAEFLGFKSELQKLTSYGTFWVPYFLTGTVSDDANKMGS